MSVVNIDEIRRIDALKSFAVLDTDAERVFDDLTRLAANICSVPISLISLVDEERQWFKSHHGLDASETPREHAFCAHAIESDQPFVIEDASRDNRFIHNPLVTGDPHIRFYAGLPLVVSGGAALGTLCVIDRQPRRLSDNQMETLGILRDAVVSHLELRRTITEIHSLRQLLPVCAWCRNVKVDDDESADETWIPIEDYVSQHAAVTHGICPSCSERMLGDIDKGPN